MSKEKVKAEAMDQFTECPMMNREIHQLLSALAEHGYVSEKIEQHVANMRVLADENTPSSSLSNQKESTPDDMSDIKDAEMFILASSRVLAAVVIELSGKYNELLAVSGRKDFEKFDPERIGVQMQFSDWETTNSLAVLLDAVSMSGATIHKNNKNVYH